jgi:hypothetical protein
MPNPRWNAALAVSDQREQIYLFGGSSYTEGSCSNQVFCLDYNLAIIQRQLAEVARYSEEALLLTKNYYKRSS